MAEERSFLLSIPLDLIEYVFENLKLDDIKNVRLTCKRLSTIGPRFKSFFAKQTTDLSSDSLRQQKALASHPLLRSAVSTLVVMAAVIDTSELDRMLKTRRHRVVEVNGPFTTTTEPDCTEEELAQAAKDFAYMDSERTRQKDRTLDESIDSLAAVLTLYGTIDTIDMDACITKGPNKRVSAAQAGEWPPVFIRASEVYRITTSAIVKSQVRLKTLLIYRATPRCSVTSFDVTAHMSQLEALPGFASAAASLENFALSFSTRVQTDFSKIEAAREQLEGAAAAFHNAMGSNAGQYSHDDPEAIAEENFPGIARILSRMTKLDAFDLHMMHTLKGLCTSYQKIFASIANDVKLPFLTQVFIRGLPSSEESLFKFIESHSTISDFNIREMELTSGSWENVIQRLLQMPAIVRLSLSNLWGSGGLFNLLLKNTSQDEYSKFSKLEWSYHCLRGIMVHTRIFDCEEIQSLKAGIDFNNASIGRPLGSYAVMKWSNSRQLEFFL
ncbi:hypothetical protein N431DRAFT_485681 [Stipitochalara longipes BDJ]|nr:hypothetical protein N431DRAFT_485681 [Stipitochalara longipes BDJ]